MSIEDITDILNTSADIFANSSAETINEIYPPPPVFDIGSKKIFLSPNSDNLLSKFIADSNNPQRICCPFCIFDFGFEYLLKEHIKNCHPIEIKFILNSRPGEVSFYQCPFCEAKFYHKDLLPKHVMRKHELCVVNMFSGFNPEKYVYCRFCPHKILRKHYKLLMIHIDKKHLPLFEKYVIEKYSNITSYDDLKEVELIKKDAVLYESPGLSLHMGKLTTTEQVLYDSPVKSILKPRTAYPIEATETVDDIMFNGEVSVLYANLEVKPKKARRKLRFELPENNDFEEKENINVTPRKKTKVVHGKSPKWLNLLKSKKRESLEESLDTKLLFHFKCGICSEGFRKNSKLAEHIKKKHKGVSLQAQYCCGDCDAKFYRNSFLRRHSKFHHSPLCLKSSFVKECGKF